MSELADLLMRAYLNEPCRVCGRMIEEADLRDLIWAGTSEKYIGSRTMHRRCFEGFVDMLHDDLMIAVVEKMAETNERR